MISGRKVRIVVLIGRDGSLSPLEIAAAAEEIADITFMMDARELRAGSAEVYKIASCLAPTMIVGFDDFPSCLSLMREARAATAVTFVDRYCSLVARLNIGFDDPDVIWGRKDRQRELLVAAAVSNVRHTSVSSEDDLRSFVRSVGFPIVVKPIDGFSSRDLWVLKQYEDVDSLIAALGADGTEPFGGMFAEEFITGDKPQAAHLADYVSAELFRYGRGDATGLSFITDRLLPVWPCREAGILLPTLLSPLNEQQVISAGMRALDALSVGCGPFHVEIKPKAPSPDIIEVNGRLGGFIAHALQYASGIDLGKIAIAAALGENKSESITWHRCVSLLQFQAPAAAVRIVGAPRRSELMRLPDVLSLDHLQAPGSRLDWRNGTAGAVALVWLSADDHDGLHRKLVRVAEFLTTHFVFADKEGRIVREISWFEQIARGFMRIGTAPGRAVERRENALEGDA